MTAKFEHFPLTHAPKAGGATGDRNDAAAGKTIQRMARPPSSGACLYAPGITTPADPRTRHFYAFVETCQLLIVHLGWVRRVGHSEPAGPWCDAPLCTRVSLAV